MNVTAWSIRFLWRILKITLAWQANVGIAWLLIQIEVSKKLSMRKVVLFHAAYNTPWAQGFGDLEVLSLEVLYVGWKLRPKT